MQHTMYLKPGRVINLSAANDIQNGNYQVMRNPGEPSDAPMTLASGMKKRIGPFAQGRYLKLWSEFGDIEYKDGSLDDDFEEGIGEAGDNINVDESRNFWKRSVLELKDAPVEIKDDAGVGQYASIKLYQFPKGAVFIQAIMLKGQLQADTNGQMSDDFKAQFALGSQMAGNGVALGGDKADIMPAKDFAAAADKKADADNMLMDAKWLEAADEAKAIYLNVKIDDAAAHEAGDAKFSGRIEIIWLKMGENDDGQMQDENMDDQGFNANSNQGLNLDQVKPNAVKALNQNGFLDQAGKDKDGKAMDNNPLKINVPEANGSQVDKAVKEDKAAKV